MIFIPTLLCVAWMGAFGGTAISQVVADASAPVAAVAQELKLFEMVQDFPFSALLSMVGIVLVLVFLLPHRIQVRWLSTQ